jgi:sugar-specific transcriptional regulator TrmB
VLEPIGVRSEDETVYRELLSRPEASQRDLAAALDRGSAEVGSSLGRLEELGLVHRLPGQPARMRAVRPDVAVDALVDRRREELARTQLAGRNLLAEMPAEERFRPEEIVEVLVGRAAIAARFEHLLSTTRHEFMVLDHPPYVADPQRSDNSVRRLLRTCSAACRSTSDRARSSASAACWAPVGARRRRRSPAPCRWTPGR